MGVGSKLDYLMKKRGTNASELARKVSVTPSTIYSIISRDSKKVDLSVLRKLAHALDVSIDYFCDDVDIPITISLHFDESEYTREQLERIQMYARFLKEHDKK